MTGSDATTVVPLWSPREVDVPTLVLGSTQPHDDVDEDAARHEGVKVVARRSGGGAVLLLPGEAVWVEVALRRDDLRWDDDVSRSGLWLGEAWAAALDQLGLGGATVHRGPMSGDLPLGRVVCFAALAPGELAIQGNKVVGVSQRRTRDRALFECVALRSWEPDLYEVLLGPGLRRLGVPAGTLAQLPVATVGLSSDELLDSLPHFAS